MSLTGFHPYGIRSSHKAYRPSPTKDVTEKDPPLIRGPLIGGYTVYRCHSSGNSRLTPGLMGQSPSDYQLQDTHYLVT
jgi:hypothetical protein